MQEKYDTIKKRIEVAHKNAELASSSTTLVAVSKTFSAEEVLPFLQLGHRVFGENRVQEAAQKWPRLREKFSDIQLHLIGPLQSNKTKEAVELFDVIETVDREKIALSLRQEMTKQNRFPELFVQINIGEESQKAGINPQETHDFLIMLREKYQLNISGLMCIPPANENPGPYFARMYQLAQDNNISNLSMGMSADFEIALRFGATHVRVGTALFGQR